MTILYVDEVLEQVPATDTEVYTAPTNVKAAFVTYCNCTCEDATGSSITVNLVKSGGSVAVTNQYLQLKAIAAGATDNLTELVGATLKAGDSIYAVAANADRLNLKISVKEVY